jgi:phosphocarrier protein
MKSFDYTITDELGIHARPAGLIVKKAREFACDIYVEQGDKSVNIKNIFGIMGLGVKCNDTITIKCEGEDEEQAAEALKKVFQENL